jgi:4-diphosphocytidyl-2-C-methyl-D-erythritol kinase
VRALIDKIICPVKINLTLRVLSLRPDGYHEIYSAFWKKKGTEVLTISSNSDENIGDKLEVQGLKFEGPNILTKVLMLARERGAKVPPLCIRLDKHFPSGSGIGAGSGNAAALMSWLAGKYNITADSTLISRLGADVSFLALGCDLAIAEGIGEKLTPVEPLEGLSWVIAFPSWKSDTAYAYTKLDQYRKTHKISVSEKNFSYEALEILDKLRKKDKVGLLPNDFLGPLLSEHMEYETAFTAADRAGALAWGLCGSGSAVFAVCKDDTSSDKLINFYKSESWIIKITKLE